MKILITGASGFLGRALCARLETQGHMLVKLNSKNCDLRIPDHLKAYNDQRVDQIFHLAAWTQAGDFCLYHPGEQWIFNQQINTNILNWWQQYQPQAKMICMGTSCAYAPELELMEENYLQGLPIQSLFTYAMTKRMLYVGLLALNQQYGLNYLMAVPSTLYGPGYHTDGRQMHFIFDLIQKILRGKYENQPVVLWGDGYQKRELVYIDDFVTALLKINENVNNDLINIGAGEEHSIRTFASLISREIGYPEDAIQYDTHRYVGARSKLLKIEKLKQLLPNFEFSSLKDGLVQTLEWFRDQPQLYRSGLNEVS